jgi:hypothetical protein
MNKARVVSVLFWLGYGCAPRHMPLTAINPNAATMCLKMGHCRLLSLWSDAFCMLHVKRVSAQFPFRASIENTG